MTYGMGPTGLPPNTTGTGQMKEKIPSGYKKGSMQQFTPEQMQLHQQQYGYVGPESYLSKLAGGDESMFGQIEAPAMKQFSQLQGQLGSRFSGMGTGGQKSSGFQNTMNSAAQDFASQLQANRLNIRNQALQDLMGYSNQILGQKPYENFMYEKQKKGSGWGGALGALGGGALGFFAGGPAGALQGASMGYGIGNSFGGGGGSGGMPSFGGFGNFGGGGGSGSGISSENMDLLNMAQGIHG